MKKFKKFLFIAAGVLVISAGCGKGNAKPNYYTQDIVPNIVQIGDVPGAQNEYCYMVDRNTGVVYLYYATGYKGALSVMLNPDGSPITAEQLGIQY